MDHRRGRRRSGADDAGGDSGDCERRARIRLAGDRECYEAGEEE